MASIGEVNVAQGARRPPPDVVASSDWTLLRITGYAACGLWLALGTAVLWAVTFGLDTEIFAKYGPRLLHGVWVTVQLVVISICLGALLAIPLALARLSPIKAVSRAAFAYVYFFRGTPLLAQLFLIYYGAGSPQLQPLLEDLGLWWFFRDAFNCVILSFTLNTAAYQAEILKGAIQNVPQGQREAAKSMGLSDRVTFFKIIMPQALITALRPLGNEVILMVLGSAVASIVTIFDLMGATKLAFSRTYNFEVYLWAAILYLGFVEALRFLLDRLEKHMTRHLRR